MRVAVCISGRGSNLMALLDALAGDAAARVVLVISDRPDAGGLARAAERQIPTGVLGDASDPAEWLDLLAEQAVDLVVLAGFLKLVPAAVVAR